jgi:hypothetical protein
MLWCGGISAVAITVRLGQWSTGSAGLTGWLAWPLSGVAGLLGGAALALATVFGFELIKLLCVGSVDLLRSLLRFVVTGPIGDLALACTRQGRFALTRARLRRALGIAALIAILSVAVGFAIAAGAYSLVRLAFGVLWFVPLFAMPWPGDIRKVRNGLLAVVALGCAGLYLGSWSVCGAAVFLTGQSLVSLAPGMRKGQELGLWVTWIAAGACLASRVAVGGPSLVWVLALAALSGLASFVGFSIDASKAPEQSLAAGAATPELTGERRAP